MATLRRLPNGKYEVKICGRTLEGKRIFKTFIKNTPEECEKAVREFYYLKEQGFKAEA